MKLLFATVSIALLAISNIPKADAFVSNGVKTSSQSRLSLSSSSDDQWKISEDNLKQIGHIAASAMVALSIFVSPAPSFADGQTEKFKLPPIDRTDKGRCTLSSSSMGQANAARDKLYDLRECKLSEQDASGFDLSGVIMTKTDVSNSKFIESYFSKGYLKDSTFDGADFSNAIVDRASFEGSSLKGTIFTNAVLTGTNFNNADVENADFTDAYIGDFDIRLLCKNPTLKGENPVTGADTRMSAGCKLK